MNRKNRLALFAYLGFIIICSGCQNSHQNDVINLAGQWTIRLDPQNKGVEQQWFKQVFEKTMHLPGTTDEAGLGNPENVTDAYNALTRSHYYVGKAWYQREIEIPQKWDGKQVKLLLERCHWLSQVWVDGQYAGSQNSLCVAQQYDLSPYLSPGKHRLSICIDNKYPFSLGEFASSVSEHTQSNWNGIVGRIELQAKDPVYIDDLRVYPNIKNNQAKVTCKVINHTGQALSVKLLLNAALKDGGKIAGRTSIVFTANKDTNLLEMILPMGNNVQLWDEFNPILYRLKARLKTDKYADTDDATFGMREVGVDGTIFTINGKRTYMRGNLECCIFPQTGYPSMSVEGWLKVLQTMKDCGLNHMRTHSWCPPKAAFEAADVLGMYIQAEAPRANVNSEPRRDKFILDELLRMNRAYGNHPSFMFVTGGNELNQHGPDDGVNANMIAIAMKDDNRHLYSTTSGGHGMDHKQSRNQVDQYRVGGARGFRTPGTNEDHSNYYSNYPFASLTHEVGQHGVYPNLSEIPHYTGVLKPTNLEAIKRDLGQKGMLKLAPRFTDATAHHAAILYKEEIEILMRSKGNAGFQLLSLQDYPGQGTAHVGLFNALWENKGGISKEDFRKFCSPLTPLLRMEKRTYTSNEHFVAQAEILNYGPRSLNNVQPVWKLKNLKNEVIQQGSFDVKEIAQGERVKLGEININLSFIKSAEKLNVSVELEDLPVINDWDIWCYPMQKIMAYPSNLVVRHTLDAAAKQALADGAKVLLLPTKENLNHSVPGNAKTVFWSPDWWWTKVRGGNTSMSILCDPKHPLFKNFPTEYYSNWQWWSLLQHSNSIVLDTLNVAVVPIVRVIDNFRRNHNLANVLECRVLKGSLFICSMDIETGLDKRPEAQQLRSSIIAYMLSEDFSPSQSIEISEIQKLFK